MFEVTKSYDQVYKWFEIITVKGFQVCAFVIMPNHLHFILATPLQHPRLNTLISNGKRFMAYGIVARLRQYG
ncbi:MAG: hypothetical protein WBB36_12780, partial [Chitinophagales bacterium]